MFQIRVEPGGQVFVSGRLDAAESENALPVFRTLEGPTVVDCSDLAYISSAGISVIMDTYKRLNREGHSLRLVNPTRHVRTVFMYTGLDKLLGMD